MNKLTFCNFQSFRMKNIDLLKHDFDQETDKIKKIAIALQIIDFLSRNAPKEALKYIEKAYLICLQIGDKKLEIDVLNEKANVLKNIGNYTEAEVILSKVIQKSKVIKYNTGKAFALSTKGFIAYRKGETDIGIKHCEKAVLIFEKEKHTKGIARANTNLGAVYFGSADFGRSLPYSLKANDIYEKLNDDTNRLLPFYNIAAAYIITNKFEEGVPMTLEGLALSKVVGNREIEANCYNLLGAYYFEIKDYNQASINWQESLKIRLEMESWDYVRMSMANLSSAFLSANQTEKAIEMNTMLLSYVPQIENPHILATIYSTVAYTQEHLKNWSKALENYLKALQFSVQAENKQFQRKANEDISRIYEMMEDFENALIYYKKYKTLYDEIFTHENEKIILELERNLKIKQKEALLLAEQVKNARLEKENTTIKNQKNALESKVKNLTAQQRFETNNCGILTLDDIIYLEANGEKTKIYTTTQPEPFSETQLLGGLETQLPHTYFFRVHKSYIINGYFLARKTSQKYFLKNGFEINTSRKYKPDLSVFLNQK